MKLIIDGKLYTDPFGVPWLKSSRNVHQEIDLSGAQSGFSTSLMGGEVTVGVSLQDNAGEIDAEIKVAILHLPVFDRTFPIASHVGNGPVPVRAGGGQASFTGTVQVVA